MIRTDRADLTLASEDRKPRFLGDGETPLSTTPFPLLPTTRSTCYMGDYIQVTADRHVPAEFGDDEGRSDDNPPFRSVD
ncbi:MAG: hypothetical protein JOZ65_07155 [Chloroflexi bacterium]|nr:hypothetical protein [Chloroflexota bacterium]